MSDLDDDDDYELESLRLAALSSLRKGERRESVQSVPDPSENVNGGGIIYEVAITDDYEPLDAADTSQHPYDVAQPIVDDTDDLELRALRNAALQSHKAPQGSLETAISANFVVSPESPPSEVQKPAAVVCSAAEPDEAIDLLYGDLNMTSTSLCEEADNKKKEAEERPSPLGQAPIKTASESSTDNMTTSVDGGQRDWQQAKGRYQRQCGHDNKRRPRPPILPLPPLHARNYYQQLHYVRPNLPPFAASLPPHQPVIPWAPQEYTNPSVAYHSWQQAQEHMARLSRLDKSKATLPGHENHVPIFSSGSSDSDSGCERSGGQADEPVSVKASSRQSRHSSDGSRHHQKDPPHQHRSRDREYYDNHCSSLRHWPRDQEYYESHRRSHRHGDHNYSYVSSRHYYRSPSPGYSHRSRQHRASPSHYYSRSPSPDYWRYPPEYYHSSSKHRDPHHAHSSYRHRDRHRRHSPHSEHDYYHHSRHSRRTHNSQSRSRDVPSRSRKSSPLAGRRKQRGRSRCEGSHSSSSGSSCSELSHRESDSEGSSRESGFSPSVKQSAADSSVEVTAQQTPSSGQLSRVEAKHTKESPRKENGNEESDTPSKPKLKSYATFHSSSRKESKGRLASAVVAVVTSSSPTRTVLNKDERIIIQTPGRLHGEVQARP